MLCRVNIFDGSYVTSTIGWATAATINSYYELWGFFKLGLPVATNGGYSYIYHNKIADP